MVIWCDQGATGQCVSLLLQPHCSVGAGSASSEERCVVRVQERCVVRVQERCVVRVQERCEVIGEAVLTILYSFMTPVVLGLIGAPSSSLATRSMPRKRLP